MVWFCLHFVGNLAKEFAFRNIQVVNERRAIGLFELSLLSIMSTDLDETCSNTFVCILLHKLFKWRLRALETTDFPLFDLHEFIFPWFILRLRSSLWQSYAGYWQNELNQHLIGSIQLGKVVGTLSHCIPLYWLWQQVINYIHCVCIRKCTNSRRFLIKTFNKCWYM